MKQVYEIQNVQMVVGYRNYAIHDDGKVEERTYQTITHDGLYSKEKLFEIMKAKVAPGEEFDITIGDGVEK